MERDYNHNCWKCGKPIFVASVDRGTNGGTSITYSIGCSDCKSGDYWTIGRSIPDAFSMWDRLQRKEAGKPFPDYWSLHEAENQRQDSEETKA